MVLVSLIPYKHFQRYITKVVPEPEFRIYLELFEEIALMQAGLRRIGEAENALDSEEVEKFKVEVRERQVTIDRIQHEYKDCLNTRQTIQEFA